MVLTDHSLRLDHGLKFGELFVAFLDFPLARFLFSSTILL